MSFFLGPFLEWFLVAISWLAFIYAFLWYSLEGTPSSVYVRKVSLRVLLWCAAGARIIYALLLTIGQYYVWTESAFTLKLLASPLTTTPLPIVKKLPWIFESNLGYFVMYSWQRFWLGALLSIFVAWLFYLFLKTLKRHNERFFKEGEVELGFLMALLVGWPGQVLFIPLIFLSVIFVSLVRLVVFREQYTTLGWPFLLSAFVVFGWGAELLLVLHLTALKI